MSRIHESDKAQSVAEYTGVSNLNTVGKAGLLVAGLGMTIFGFTIGVGATQEIKGGTKAIESVDHDLVHLALDGVAITMGGLMIFGASADVTSGENGEPSKGEHQE